MKRVIAIATIFMTSAVFAETSSSCPTIEFAELNSMSKEELLRERCAYDDAKSAYLSAAPSSRNPMGLLRETERCAREGARMDRILAQKYKLKDEEHNAIYVQVLLMCRSERRVESLMPKPAPQPTVPTDDKNCTGVSDLAGTTMQLISICKKYEVNLNDCKGRLAQLTQKGQITQEAAEISAQFIDIFWTQQSSASDTSAWVKEQCTNYYNAKR